MTDKYQHGDVLENKLEESRFTLVIHTPSQRQDDYYLVLDLVLQLSKEAQDREGSFRIPPKALKRLPASMINSDTLYHKIDYIKWGEGTITGAVGPDICMEEPLLFKYLRVDKNY